MKRESFASRIGFLLVSAGCAIGLGNVWKFPYVTGVNGGGVFVLFYLLFLILIGVPVLTMELAIGRGSGLGITRAYNKLEPKKSKWHIHGWVCLFGNYIFMMFYTVISGWMLDYFFKFLTGQFENVAQEDVAGVFTTMLGSGSEQGVFMAVTAVLGILICSLGIQKGVEKITTVMMTGLLALIIVLAVHSLTLTGAAEGLRFYLLPDFARAREAGLGSIIAAAMNQCFFTLSLGIASMEIFGSYMSKSYSLGGEAVRIAALDTFVAVMSGLITFPVCFTYGVEPAQGPSLALIALPQIFIHMPGGRVWGTLFFLFLTFASLSTVVAVYENLIAMDMDSFGWSRKKSSVINLCILLVGCLPTVLNYSVFSGVRLIGGRDIFDSEDFLVSNLLLPVGSLVFVLFCTTKWGWNFDHYLAEANEGSGIKLSPKLKPYFQFILPILILVILIQGLL